GVGDDGLGVGDDGGLESGRLRAPERVAGGDQQQRGRQVEEQLAHARIVVQRPPHRAIQKAAPKPENTEGTVATEAPRLCASSVPSVPLCEANAAAMLT